jgi:glycosyltransferase involved in cell wall biosynthesis
LRPNLHKKPAQRSNRPLPDEKPLRILLPLVDLEEARLMLPLTEILMEANQGQVLILHIHLTPKDKPLSEAAAGASSFREALGAVIAMQPGFTAQMVTIVRDPENIWEGIWEIVLRENIDLLIFAWESPGLKAAAGGDTPSPRLASPPCGIVSIYASENLPVAPGWLAVRHILLPVRGEPHAMVALQLANALAVNLKADITLLHAAEQAAPEAEARMMNGYSAAFRNLASMNRSITVVGDVSQVIIQEASQYDLVIMGAPTRELHADGWTNSMLDAIQDKMDKTLILVKEKGQVESAATANFLERRRRARIRQGYNPVSVVVDQWFAENTYHSREFADPEHLLALKKSQGVTISLGLPALNEAETVGTVIQTVKSNLMDRIPLLDEIVLIDSGSADYTREIANDLNIPVYIHQEILPQYGAYTGKGEALWKSLHVLKGDLLAWIDTDIKNIHPRFVYGILGPLLQDPKIQYVKGFYRRPLRQGDKLIAGGGGRVTELTARPFINLFFPELSGLIQPLSGEYAGRRDTLEKLPFFTGYGVETGLLIDIRNEIGLNAIAQVDLQERVHHNQPLGSLSKMSFAIIQVVMSRLEERHHISLLEDANLTMNVIRYGPNRYYLETVEIQERERPPMLTIPEYRQKRGLPPLDTLLPDQFSP